MQKSAVFYWLEFYPKNIENNIIARYRMNRYLRINLSLVSVR